ncbi:hypothetical protein OEB96_43410 [Paraliomyxa miuraensis]|nr:hypothetical protein [Paraliomyxa miuraensis]MCX4247544.1 hypothetical protein [Paraliomyxa miuraensis]
MLHLALFPGCWQANDATRTRSLADEGAVGGHEELDVREATREPETETLLPCHVEMGIDLVDEHDARLIADVVSILREEREATPGCMEPSHQVDDQRGSGTISVAHLLEVKHDAVLYEPKAIGIDMMHLASIGEEPVIDQGEHLIAKPPGTRLVLERTKMLELEPIDGLGERR